MGSVVFQNTVSSVPQASQRIKYSSPTTRTPFGVFLSSTAVPRHRGRYLLVITLRSHTHYERATPAVWLLTSESAACCWPLILHLARTRPWTELSLRLRASSATASPTSKLANTRWTPSAFLQCSIRPSYSRFEAGKPTLLQCSQVVSGVNPFPALSIPRTSRRAA